MLVDVAGNDANRVCKPEMVKVDILMQVEKFSHVTHLASQVAGVLRDGLTRFDAIRSIFPLQPFQAHQKSERSSLSPIWRRNVERTGAVGRFNFARDSTDTCIAIRTMTFKGGAAYLQAGGAVVFDSVEEEEYVETINKLAANVDCISNAEKHYSAMYAEDNA